MSSESVRAAFEAWLKENELDPHRHPEDGDYTAECTTERAWAAYQAATALCIGVLERHKRLLPDTQQGHAGEDYLDSLIDAMGGPDAD